MASESKVIYTGMTNDLENRVYQHKHKLDDGFSKDTILINWYGMMKQMMLLQQLNWKKRLKAG